MKISEIRALDKGGLKKALEDVKSELIKINAQIAIGTTPKSPGRVKELKKAVAKIKTVMRGEKKDE